MQAVVVDRRVDEDSDGDTYYITYQFQVPSTSAAARRYTREESLDQAQYQYLERGTTLPVRYVSTNPDISRITGNTYGKALFFSLFGIFWNLVTWISIWLTVPAMLRDARLNRSSCVLMGEVIHCNGDKDSDGDFTLRLKYRFLSPSGVPLDGTEQLLRNDLDEYRLPRPGTPVAILYAHDGCYKGL